MAKPIRINESMKKKAKDEFAELLAELKMSDGTISFSKAFRYENATATLWLTQLAYSKTVALVTTFSDEVAWHGTAVRKSKNEFVIEDIYVYPQEVTGSTVNTDQDRYTQWLYEFEDSEFSKIRMQGHSHVSMGVSPSGVDDSHREKILAQLDADMYYIFIIWNRALKTHVLIYDMENNVLYEDCDVDVKIIGDDSMEPFLADANGKVQKKKPVTFRAKRTSENEPEPQESLWDHCYGHGCDRYGQYEL